jgi:hypothetical protein
MIITTLQTTTNNSERTQALINHNLYIIANQTRSDAIVLAELQNVSATHTSHILQQINMTVNHTKL